ncbi:hypothetical protein [Parapedobacter tibetensis]|uniref:hypothetical protein n=1 Tax=Parapedobacter tibetensis TaxID=2972951 RepID=UPI00214D3B4D|nr:hypothetical protein [Parapedobacter tibetensis]
MVRTIITPDNISIKLSIPKKYIGRKIEVIYYPVDEVVEEKTEAVKQPKTMASFKGLLSGKEADELQEYVAKSREEWERDI